MESLFKDKMGENNPNLSRDFDIQEHETQGSPNNINSERSSPMHTKTSKIKTKRESLEFLEKKKLVTYKGTLIRQNQQISQQNAYRPGERRMIY